MLMGLVGILQCLNEYGELETVNPGDWAKASVGVAVEASVAGVLSVLSFLTVLFVLIG